MHDLADLLLSCWVIESARAKVLENRGLQEQAVRSAARSRVVASACAAAGQPIIPAHVAGHARWMESVAGSEAETGLWSWMFLQRLGMYVDAHLKDHIDDGLHSRLVELSEADNKHASDSLSGLTLPPPPPPEWPETEPPELFGKPRASFGILGDPHCGTKAAEDFVPAALADMNELPFVIAVGDITQSGRAEQYEIATRLFHGHKVLPTLGNHDMWAGGPERFEETFGTKPYYVHEQGGIRVVVLDSANPAASPFPPFDLLTGTFSDDPPESIPGGEFSQEMIDWMSSIEAGPPTFLLMHHPPHPYLGFPPLVFGLDEKSTVVLEDFAASLGTLAIFCGHTHRSALSDLGGTPVIEVPAAKEWPFGYGVVRVTESAWSYQLKPISSRGAVEKWSASAGVLFRRYARGPDQSRSFIGSV